MSENVSEGVSGRAAIVIFGAAVRPDGRPSGALRRRVEAAARFGAALDAPLFMPTGGVGRHGPSEAGVMAGLLREFGVEAGRIVLEETGVNTLGSVRACARLLRAREHRGQVYAASSAYHLPRCLLLLRLGGVPARPVPIGASGNVGLARRWYWRLRAKNNRIVASGEAFNSREACMESVLLVTDTNAHTPIVDSLR